MYMILKIVWFRFHLGLSSEGYIYTSGDFSAGLLWKKKLNSGKYSEGLANRLFLSLSHDPQHLS